MFFFFIKEMCKCWAYGLFHKRAIPRNFLKGADAIFLPLLMQQNFSLLSVRSTIHFTIIFSFTVILAFNMIPLERGNRYMESQVHSTALSINVVAYIQKLFQFETSSKSLSSLWLPLQQIMNLSQILCCICQLHRFISWILGQGFSQVAPKCLCLDKSQTGLGKLHF